MNFTNSTADRGPDGRVWFATDNGLIWIDPTYVVTNRLPPPVSILSISSDQERHTSPAGVTFAAGTRAVEIDYTALSLSIPERIAFRYRLDGVDEQWQEVGNRRQAYYTSMAPGTYRFHVIASNNDGVWNQQGAQFAFEILPPWWSTTWFRALSLFALGLAGYAAYSYRVRQIALQFEGRLEERLTERTRIARELHDTLIQGFQGLMFRLQAVRALLPGRSGEAVRALDIALERGSQAIAEGRDAVQGLRASALGHPDLARGLTKVGQDLAAAQMPHGGASFHLLVEGRSRSLDPLVRDDIYRIASEALSNAFQHAQATEVEAEITYGDDAIRVRVRDNGKGLDAGIRARGGRAGHWGLAGMRERARALGGRLDVWSQDGAGTEVDLTLPLPGARPRTAWWPWPGAIWGRRRAREQQS
jgi:signal transduction histidine kinase